MCDNVVCCASVTALAVGGYLLVGVVWVGVLEDHVPGVQKAGEESETAKREVDEGVGAANSFLHPDTYGWELVGVLVGLTVSCAKQLVPAAEGRVHTRTLRSIKKQSDPHMMAVLNGLEFVVR